MCNKLTRHLFERALSAIEEGEYQKDQILPCASRFMLNLREASMEMMVDNLSREFEDEHPKEAKNVREHFSDNSELALGCAMQFIDNAIEIRGGTIDEDSLITFLVSATEVFYKTFSMPSEIVPVCFPLELVDFYPVIDGMSQEISESLIQLAQKES